MSPEKFAVAVVVVIFGAGFLGLSLQRVLPEGFTTGASRDMVGAVVGLLTLLSALVLGLLIWTAYGVYSGQNLAVQTLAARVLQLDLALAGYGPEANPLRKQLRDNLGKTIDQIWNADQSDAEFIADNFSAAIRNMRAREGALAELHPTTDEQKQALASATATMDAIAQARLQMSFALAAPVSYPLVYTVFGWALCLFLGYGLMSKHHPMALVTVFVGAVAVASAFYLILDLSSPYSGIFRSSPAPLEQVLAVMGKE